MGNEQSAHRNVIFSSQLRLRDNRLRFSPHRFSVTPNASRPVAARNLKFQRGPKCLTRRIESPNRDSRIPAGPTVTRGIGIFVENLAPLFWPATSRMQATIASRHGAADAAGYRTCSGAKEHEPDHTEDQHGQSGRRREQSKHRRPGFGLAGFGRSFNDLLVLSQCHGALDSAGVNAFRQEVSKQRMIPGDVPGT
jgi:hypothetical protein